MREGISVVCCAGCASGGSNQALPIGQEHGIPIVFSSVFGSTGRTDRHIRRGSLALGTSYQSSIC